jgi:hypothetical protein
MRYPRWPTRFEKVEHLGRRNPEGVRQHANIDERYVALPALDAANVGPGQLALQREPLLRALRSLAKCRPNNSRGSYSMTLLSKCNVTSIRV